MKFAGSYPSLLRGVSQQSPEVRQPGQHTEQVNMLSDPVAGLTRRPGTMFRAMYDSAANNLGTVSGATALLKFATANGYRSVDHTANGREYVILFREIGTAATRANSLPPVIVYNKTQHRFHNVAAASQIDLIHTHGVSAVCSVGKYLIFTVNNTPCTVTETPALSINGVTWIRGGAYDRTYKISWASGLFSVSYTTPAAGVAGAATAISPQNIAAQLATAIAGAGYAVAVYGSHIHHPGITTPAGSDGGDGSLIRCLSDKCEDVSRLTVMAPDGMKVQVGSSPSQPGFYVQAKTKDGSGFGDCIWTECSGYTRSTPQNIWLATISVDPGSVDDFIIGGGIGAPTWVPPEAGDLDSNPTPRWMKNQVTYLGMFQDRLLIGSGAEVAVSAAGDYLNPWRSSVTTVSLKDGFSMIAQGGEDDILRHSVAYNRNIVIFGDKKQYIISGSTALTATSANMGIMTVYADAATTQPIAAGGQIYYARNRDGNVAVHQIQPGTYVDSAESFPASAQIGTYIPANAAEIKAVPGAPAQLLIRSRSQPRTVYTFSYLDQPDGRKQDAWSKWEYAELCGTLLGMSVTPDNIVMIWARYSNGQIVLVADTQSLNPELSALPYLDSIRPYSTVATTDDEVAANTDGWQVAFDNTTDRFLIGGDSVDAAELATAYPTEYPSLWCGLPFDSYVTPTNPYQKDGSGRAILSGRTVITRLLLSLRRSAGMVATVTSGNATTEYSFNGRVLGDLLNQIGKVPVSDTSHTVSIGREGREYSVKLGAQRWYPFTIVTLEYTGQAFNRTPRA